MAGYGVIFDIQQQQRYARVQIAIRVLIIIIASLLSFAVSPILGLIYLAIPVMAAIYISQKGAAGYLADHEQSMTRWLRLLLAVYAYLIILTDRLPNEDPKETLRFDVEPRGEPSAGGVLLRIITSIPHWFVLGLLGIIGGILLLVAAIMVLIQESYPEGIFNFQRGIMRWSARVYAYMAGLVQEYPPFAFDTGPETDTAMTSSPVTPPPAAPPTQAPPTG